MDRRQIEMILPAIALGMAVALIFFVMVVPRPSAVVAPFKAAPKKIMEIDCSGSPHVTIRGDSMIFTGWKDDREVTVYNDGHRDDIDITGLLCSVSIREDI